jgi:hypothetical protein
MSTRHLLLTAVAGIIIISGVSTAAAQPAAPQPPRAAMAPPPNPLSPGPLSPGPRPPVSRSLPTFPGSTPAPAAKPAQARSPDPPPITFFLATGPADACGPGCDGWIAADGKIDLDAAQRLRKVLTKLGQRKAPPLFLHSAGGSVLGAIALGRLIRRHNITVSVARTTPVECPHDPQPNNKACESLKRSGRDLVAELDTSRGICNSACVLVLAGGAVRSVPPWVKLGVHAIGFDLTKTPLRGPALAEATRAANASIVEYLHDMGIPKALFDASNAVPHESPRFLHRDELARFGLDTRAFGQSDWRFTEKPSMAIAKGFFVRTGDAGLAYPEALLRLSCSAGKAMSLTFARERAEWTAGSRPVRVTVNGMRIDLPYTSRSQAGKIEIRTAGLVPDTIASAGDDAAVEISGFDGAAVARPPDNRAWDSQKTGDDPVQDHIVLNMAGFSAAYAKLRKACDDQASAHNACGAEMSLRCMPEAIQTWRAAPSSPAGPAWPTP